MEREIEITMADHMAEKKSEQAWLDFLRWWNPRNEDEENPARDHPRARRAFEAYCWGRCDGSHIGRRDSSSVRDVIHERGCTPMGEYRCQVPMPINGRIQGIDFCIADIVAALNAANIKTVASCCGHGDESKSSIMLADGRELRVRNHAPNAIGEARADSASPPHQKGN